MEIISPKTDFCAKELFLHETIRKYFISDVTGIRVGENYAKLKRCISISILDFNYTEDPVYYSVYYLRDENGRLFSDLFEVHIIELRKTLDGVNSMDDWIRFFNARTEEELDMIHTTNIGINTAISEVKKMSMSERMRARYEAHMKEIRDRNAREDYVRKQGIEQGIKQGIDQEREMRIEKMLRNHKTPEEIADFCDYDLKEVEAVKEKIHLN